MNNAEIERMIKWVSVERLELGRELKAYNFDRAVGIAQVILIYVEEIQRINATQSQEVAQ